MPPWSLPVVLLPWLVILFPSAGPEPCVPARLLTGVEDCNKPVTYVIKHSNVYDDLLHRPDDKALDSLCGIYQKWYMCLTSVATRCDVTVAGMGNATSRSRMLVATMCVLSREAVASSLQCIAAQHWTSNPLYRSCKDIRQLRQDAALADSCSVTVQWLQCEDALVRSSCGSVFADFRLALSLEHRLPPAARSAHCTYTPDPNYRAFRFSLDCPPSFPLRLQKCYSQFASRQVVLHPQLLAVVRNAPSGLSAWCRAHDMYTRCSADVRATCPRGVQAVTSAITEWHRMLQLANYLCPARQVYSLHAECYKELVPRLASVCVRIFQGFPSLAQAYHAACSADRPTSQRHLQRRENLISCYTSMVEKKCGRDARDVIFPMVRLLYSYDSLPPCSLADSPPPTPCGATSLSSAIIAHHITWFMSGLLSVVWTNCLEKKRTLINR